ncbi:MULTISPECIES: arsenic resistance N-acetyltransferase ArsN2 [Mucilaginibacter]|jgi:amino-acid N-acetyltransferase|uniref:GNAT family N-acetyltransferase n=1 Tax=Mucilaginibacter rubeus TaxID=2027860 RepID=A0AAE6JJK6_9SPHI|nr:MULTISPECIES: arsenic resistance N-acetyltransferase ArsN2 [Mucilaginibacter]HEK21093.1 GNAT family N-acetyltransferase [Bacteroidota bacterium]NHA05667.1 GNAT family N-acetyltransferase [Mucilaginibacter inviolabilis]PLW90944.1 MAG: amino acid acetyltransferase [Mucilaginibacter sp.]PMP66357.1 MAG: amino acid acetyltransferase [Mucilaginibacter sp.]QEM07017.1 GNAT family N-acetyltransferase [Mucilaginibacter rubeus]
MIIDQAQTYRDKIVELLVAEKLAVADLPETLDNFIVAIQDGNVVGVGGVEVYGSYGLLRSLAVHREHRNAGIAGKLLARLDSMSKKNDLSALYLLTETASAYFERKRYNQITREEVPAEVQGSSEFSHVCPVSAIVMKKEL